MLHQITIGKESMLQIQKAEIKPNYMIACVGGGSNFAGFTFPMMHEKIQGEERTEIIAVESKTAPSFIEGKFGYDYGDIAG